MQKVIVTGAAGNLGKAVVKNFLQKSIHVLGCISLRDSTLKIENKNLDVFPLDLLDVDACRNFIELVFHEQKTIDAAVLTAGGFAANTIENVTKADFDKMFALNFNTAFNLVQPLFLKMKNQPTGGKIILIGSEPGRDISKAKGSIAYGFSKSLLFRLSELVNAEGKGKNISCHVVVPTTMDTPQNRAAMPGADFSKWISPEIIASEIAALIA